MRGKTHATRFRCGAATKSGEPCARAVELEGFRCPHHPVTTPEEKAAQKETRMRVFAKREAEADVLFAKNRFVEIALEHEQLSHPETQKAFDHLVQLTKGAKS